MKKKHGTVTSFVFALCAAIALAALPATGRAEGTSGWEHLKTEAGISVFRKEIPGSPLVAFRGEGIVDAPVLLVGSVLVDAKRSPEWMDSVVESRILRKISDGEYVTYSHVATPIVMKDRDFVTDVRIEIDSAKKQVAIRLHSVNDPTAPKTSYVRGELIDSSFVLTETGERGLKTKVVAEIHCDPKGNVADWIVNLFQKSWPYNTLHSLRAQVRKPDIQVHPLLKTAMEERGFFP